MRNSKTKETCPTARTDRWQLVKLVQATKGEIGLNARDCIVFSALVSFLPKRTADKGEIVFPSNKTLSERAGGMSERTLRRALANLTSKGIIERNDSSTKKRFPLRNYNGHIETAFGFDLRPAFKRYDELVSIADLQSSNEQAARNLRSQILARRHALLKSAQNLTSKSIEFLENLSRVLRRKLNLGTLEAIGDDLMDLEVQAKQKPSDTLDHPSCKSSNATVKLTAKNRQTDRHYKSPNIRKKITTPDSHRSASNLSWDKLQGVRSYFPKEPASITELQKIVFQLGLFLNLKDRRIAASVQKIGWSQTLWVLDYIISNIVRIDKPIPYFERMVMDRAGG